ncbi:MAG: T9SS type A sorting domain-containing protein [Bacteroidetes bacterium]|nr:T9SS type A sorting domain-containing protein [Bacteroidota bacterium]
MRSFTLLHTATLSIGLFLLGGPVSAQWTLPPVGCSIRYDYDAAGNRISRYWYCWSGPGLPQQSVAIDSSLTKSMTEEERVLEPLALQLFPNPATDRITIALTTAIDQATYDLYDGQGRRVRNGAFTGDRLELDLGGIPAGLYNFCLVRGDEMLVRSLVVE